MTDPVSANPVELEHEPVSVFSILHNIQYTISNRFPSSTAPHLHPYIRNPTLQTTAPWSADRERLLSSIRNLKLGVEKFRDTWQQGRARGNINGNGTIDDASEQKKTVLLRLMLDWCANQQSLLPVTSVLDSLLARSRSHAHPLSRASGLRRVPFVQPQTLSSPTNRLVALAQSINLEVSLDNEDPSFGMGTGDEGLRTEEKPLDHGTAGATTRIDTLALAGQRMVIDIEIAHPSPATTPTPPTGWRVISLRVERVDPEHLTGAGEGMDVDLPPVTPGLGGAGARLLNPQSRVLQGFLQSYLDAVNAYDESERHWNTHHTYPHEAEETLELCAERAVLAFGEQLNDLRAIDLKMKPLEGLTEPSSSVPMDVDMDAKPTEEEIVLWDQLDDFHSLIRSLPLTIPGPTVLPTFRPFPEGTFLVNPVCRIVLTDNVTVPKLRDGLSSGWAVEIDEPVLVTNGFFRQGKTATTVNGIAGLGAKGLEDLCGVEPSRTYNYKGSSGIQQSFLFPRSGTSGMYVDYIGLQSKEDIIPITEALRHAIWISHLLKSCVRPSEDGPTQPEHEESIDDELDMLLAAAGGSSAPAKPSDLTVIVQPTQESLNLSFPLRVPLIETQTPIVLTIQVRPDAETGQVRVSFSTDTSHDESQRREVETYVRESANEQDLASRLLRLEGNVPVWLDELCTTLYK